MVQMLVNIGIHIDDYVYMPSFSDTYDRNKLAIHISCIQASDIQMTLYVNVTHVQVKLYLDIFAIYTYMYTTFYI